MKLRLETKACKHGLLTFSPDDEFVGHSLDVYGEFSEDEVLAMSMILEEGHTVVEIGANIGTLTVPMARMVAPSGRVIAIEGHPVNAELLRRNVEQNNLTNVEVHPVLASDHEGELKLPHFSDLGHKNLGRVEVGSGSLTIPCIKLDSLCLEKVRLLKIDVEGHESEVLKGAAETIARCKPVIYIENDRPEKVGALIAQIIDLGYRAWWHRPPLFNEKNYAGNPKNDFGETVSLNMLCIREDISGAAIDGLDEVGDLRIGDPNMYAREAARFTRIVNANPNDLRARLMLAHYRNMMQETEEANALIEENLRRDPKEKATLAIRGLHILQQGNWIEGWPAYEMRYAQRNTKPFGDRPHQGVKWDGKPTDEPLLIWNEQGFGDSVMFGRFIREAAIRTNNIVVEVQPQLYELYECSKIPAIGELVRTGRKLPEYRKHCSIPSLPAVLGLTTDDEMRAKQPYLFADEEMVQHWRKQIISRIGFCWSGSNLSERPYSRDISPDLFALMTQRHGAFTSLNQQGQFESYMDTAACISSMDLVITVDTSVAHLAGALGVPTWLLLSTDPDWRWGLTGNKTVWYNSMTIFRQPQFMDWRSVVDTVSVELDRFMQERQTCAAE